MKLIKTKAFTIIELIVVITILAILGTIAFMSLQGYSKTARDSARISDMGKIKTSLELFQINAGIYPLPTSSYSVSYSGGQVWTQGIFGETTYTNVGKLNKLPLDPLLNTEYSYSVINNKKEYEIAGIMELNNFTLNNTILSQTLAEDKELIVKVTGTYNGETIQVNKGGENCIIAMPSIITSSGTTLETIVPNNYLVYNNYKNIPSNFKHISNLKIHGNPDLKIVNNSNIELHCGILDELQNNETARINYIDNFQKAYIGTQVNKDGRIEKILNLEIDTINPTPELKTYIIDIIETKYNLEIPKAQKQSASECNFNYTDDGGVCVANTKDIIISNGTGKQTWTGTNWGPIVVTSCENGYSNNTTNCVKNTWELGTWGNCNASPIWSDRSNCSNICGGGTKTRTCNGTDGTKTTTVTCKKYDGTNLNDIDCIDTKPSNSSSCSLNCIGSNSESCNTQNCVDSYGAKGIYVAYAGCVGSRDSCNGAAGTDKRYTCPSGVQKTCRDYAGRRRSGDYHCERRRITCQ